MFRLKNLIFLEKMLGTKINLKTWVKVRKDWQDEDSIVKKFKFN